MFVQGLGAVAERLLSLLCPGLLTLWKVRALPRTLLYVEDDPDLVKVVAEMVAPAFSVHLKVYFMLRANDNCPGRILHKHRQTNITEFQSAYANDCTDAEILVLSRDRVVLMPLHGYGEGVRLMQHDHLSSRHMDDGPSPSEDDVITMQGKDRKY